MKYLHFSFRNLKHILKSKYNNTDFFLLYLNFGSVKCNVAGILSSWPTLSAEVYVSETPFNHSYNDWWLPVVKPQLLIHHH